MTDIFLSYSSKDRDKVRPIRDALVAAGYSVFWDQEVPTGVEWEPWIKKHLAASRLVLVLWSKNSAVSGPVKYEARFAKHAGKLLPAFVETVDLIDHPMEFSELQSVSLYDWGGQDTHKGYQSLMVAVRSRLGGNAEAASEAPHVQRSHSGNAIEEEAERRRKVETDSLAARQSAEAIRAEAKGKEDAWKADAKRTDDARRAGQTAEPVVTAAQAKPKEEAKTPAPENGDAEDSRQGQLANAQATYEAALAHINGTRAINEREAVRLLGIAANQGLPEAEHLLGAMYENGRGVPKDLDEARRLYSFAAAKGHRLAASRLNDATKIKPSRSERLQPFETGEARELRIAANRGDTTALYRLGYLYSVGQGGVARDEEEAIYLWKLAASGGSLFAKDSLAKRGISY